MPEPAELSSRRVALTLLGEAGDACRRLRAGEDGEDGEALHDFRVGLRRLRTCLRAYRPYLDKRVGSKLFKALGKLSGATNAGRDDQVHLLWLRHQLTLRRAQLEQTGMRLLLDDLEARRQDVDPQAIETVIEDFGQISKKMRDRLQRGRTAVRLDEAGESVGFAQAAGAVLHATAIKLQLELGLITSPAEADACHDARLTSKRMRYLIEPIRKEAPGARALLRQLRRLQTVLGDLRDLQVLEKRVAAALKRATADWSGQLLDTAKSAPRLTDITRAGSRPQACYALAAVARRIGIEQHALFDALRKNWLAGHAAAFFAQLHGRICAMLPALGMTTAQDPAPAEDPGTREPVDQDSVAQGSREPEAPAPPPAQADQADTETLSADSAER